MLLSPVDEFEAGFLTVLATTGKLLNLYKNSKC